MNLNSDKRAAQSGSFFSSGDIPEFRIAVEKAKNGKEILSINGKAVHSKFAPEREAAGIRFPVKSLIAVFGLGAGYHVRNLLEANPDAYCLVLEPLFPVYQRREDFLGELLNRRVFVVQQAQDSSIFPLLQKLMRREFLRVETYSNLCYKNLFPQQETEFFRIIQQHLGIVMQNILTEANFLPLWNRNLLRHCALLAKIPFLLSEKKKPLNGNLAVICAAGPTLDAQLSNIKMYREKITIFAADTALIPLQKAGIIPDVIVCLDGQYFTLGDFICSIPEESLLVADLLAYADVATRFSSACFTVSSIEEGTLTDYLLQALNLQPLCVETGGTVTDYTLDLARQLGFRDFFFAGYDLSYPGKTTHCRNAPSWQARLSNAGYFSGMEDATLKAVFGRKYQETVTADDNGVITDFVMENYRKFLEGYISSYSDCRFTSASISAAKIEGVEYLTLDILLTQLPQSQRVLRENFFALQQCVSQEKISTLFSGVMEKLYLYSQRLKNCIDAVSIWTEESASPVKLQTEEILVSFPFLSRFLFMTQIVLDRNHVTPLDPEYFRHVSFCLLQSLYFMVRELQKVIAFNDVNDEEKTVDKA